MLHLGRAALVLLQPLLARRVAVLDEARPPALHLLQDQSHLVVCLAVRTRGGARGHPPAPGMVLPRGHVGQRVRDDVDDGDLPAVVRVAVAVALKRQRRRGERPRAEEVVVQQVAVVDELHHLPLARVDGLWHGEAQAAALDEDRVEVVFAAAPQQHHGLDALVAQLAPPLHLLVQHAAAVQRRLGLPDRAAHAVHAVRHLPQGGGNEGKGVMARCQGGNRAACAWQAHLQVDV